MKLSSKILLLAAGILAITISCKKEEAAVTPVLTIQGTSEFSFGVGAVESQTLSFRANCPWTIKVPTGVSWITVSPASGKPQKSEFETFKVALTSDASTESAKAELIISYGENSKKVKVYRSSLPKSSDFNIPDDMVFSTTLGGNSTNVAQGFDYDPKEDVVYITQKYGVFKNHIGWQKRENKNGTAVASTKMTLSCFSHGNNIGIEINDDGSKYIWAPNYGTRQDDGSYDSPIVVSRLPLEAGKTINNNETTENYFFGIKPCWPAFDFKNDLVAICNYKNFYIYRLSELKSLPVQTLTLPYSVTYGGNVGVDTKRAEFSGQPVVSVRDCRNVKPLYTVTFDYSSRGLHWQSYCIDNGWIYAILQADKKAAPEIIFDTYVEAYKMDGTEVKHKIRQEYMQNRDRILEFDWNERDYFYCEPEGIKVYDGKMLTMYAVRGNTQAHSTRRPVIFRLVSPIQ